MATSVEFAEYVIDQAGLGDRLTYKKMFGEYGFYLDGKFIALACDDSLFIKPTKAVEDHGLDVPWRAPYPRGKPHPVIDELLDDPHRLREVLKATAEHLLEPKPRKSKGSRPNKQ